MAVAGDELLDLTACFKSIFRIHTETGNIWSHMLGCVAFIGVAGWFLTRPDAEIQVPFFPPSASSLSDGIRA